MTLLFQMACNYDDAHPKAKEATATAVPNVTNSVAIERDPNGQLPNIADIVEQVRGSVVSIVAQVVTHDRFGRRASDFGSGTGVIFDESGLVLTNNHVIENGVQVIVTLDNGDQVKAEIIGSDRLSDLAVLRLPVDNYPALPITQNGSLRAGDWVIAIGNALALPGGPTVTVGVVSALGRTIEASPGITLYELIQTDTSINPGNSGGPLIDLKGNLVGINTAVFRGSSEVPIEGIGFAINMETAQQVSDQLVELGHVRWAWMGVFLADLIPEVAAQVGLPIREGVIIRDIVLNGPSHLSGIVPGDILVDIAGHDIATITDLTRLLKQEFSAGQTVDVGIFRVADGIGSRETLSLQLGERPQQ
ncbi:MAG: PDZ domain-containing protein [SAR202 cluster bacterium]|nr:MAG: PDZ domain-containing protein [SAR202 cluster bacterium]|tara:strand:+ start:1490 stop:2575 length:1086 start_codon:yes stop_codon:yes gene_type:complete